MLPYQSTDSALIQWHTGIVRLTVLYSGGGSHSIRVTMPLIITTLLKCSASTWAHLLPFSWWRPRWPPSSPMPRKWYCWQCNCTINKFSQYSKKTQMFRQQCLIYITDNNNGCELKETIFVHTGTNQRPLRWMRNQKFRRNGILFAPLNMPLLKVLKLCLC